jgi:hypothetical protein
MDIFNEADLGKVSYVQFINIVNSKYFAEGGVSRQHNEEVKLWSKIGEKTSVKYNTNVIQ